jgi:16S rRNA (guanine966-N2)-methyltransferase
MQIVAGRFRHRPLLTNPGMVTRPITQRVKVSLFDKLEPWFIDARVADIYSGTGTMGLEALSRGASAVAFFEHDKVAFDLLKQNIAALKVEDETFAWKVDVTKCSFRPKGDAARFLPFDLIFFDPPYFHAERLTPDTMLYKSLLRLAKPEISAPAARMLFRVAVGTELQLPPHWELKDVMEYSSMAVYVFQKENSGNFEPGEGVEESEESSDG